MCGIDTAKIRVLGECGRLTFLSLELLGRRSSNSTATTSGVGNSGGHDSLHSEMMFLSCLSLMPRRKREKKILSKYGEKIRNSSVITSPSRRLCAFFLRTCFAFFLKVTRKLLLLSSKGKRKREREKRRYRHRIFGLSQYDMKAT